MFKVTLLEILCDIPYVTVHHVMDDCNFQNKVIFNVLFELLRDEDQRVRSACATAIVKSVHTFYTHLSVCETCVFFRIIPNLYFEQFNQKNDTVVSKAVYYTGLYLSNLNCSETDMNLNKTHFLTSTPCPYSLLEKTGCRKTEYSLSRIITRLNNFLLISKSKHFMVCTD